MPLEFHKSECLKKGEVTVKDSYKAIQTFAKKSLGLDDSILITKKVICSHVLSPNRTKDVCIVIVKYYSRHHRCTTLISS